MQKIRQQTKDTAHPAQPEFPFLNLPRELRNEIYELSLEPQAEFCLKDLDDPWDYTEMRFCLPNLSTTRSTDELPDAVKVGLKNWLYLHPKGLGPVLFYRFFLFNALMLACKRVQAEMRDTITRMIPRTHSFIRSQIWHDRIFSNDPAFFEICRRSNFICSVSANKMATFMVHLSPDMALSIRHLIFVQGPKAESPLSTLEAWAPPSELLTPLYPKFLLIKLSNLTTVSIRFPDTWTSDERLYRDTCMAMCEMLLDGHVDTVRYLCQEPTKEHPLESLPFLTNQPAPNQLARPEGSREEDNAAPQQLVYVQERSKIFDADKVVRITRVGEEIEMEGYQIRQVEMPGRIISFM